LLSWGSDQMSPLVVATLPILCLAFLSYLLHLLPEVLLHIPGQGFRLYHIVKGAPIPPYIVPDAWRNDSNWLKKGDVVVSAMIKGGTTWAMATVHAIRQRGKSLGEENLLDVMPWVDFVRYPGESTEERIAFFKRSQSNFSFGVYKSHLHPPFIRLREDVKYIVGVRNLMDVAASLRSFMSSHTEQFRSMWGGYPPIVNGDEEFHDIYLRDKGDGKPFLLIYTDYVRSWWPLRNHSNILFLHYSDRLKSPYDDVNRLNRFLGTTLNEEEKQNVLVNSSFKYMKANNAKFAYCMSDSKNSVQQLHGKLSQSLCALNPESFVNKGPHRNGYIELTLELKEGINRICLEELGFEICNWLKDGGPLPNVELP
jgi:hypothetical protein